MAHRRKGSRNWARGVLATFWILLAGVSGLYLFSAFTDPTLGGQLAKFAPVSSGETTAVVGSAGSPAQALAEIKVSLRELTQQVAALAARLDEDAKVVAPNLSPPPDTSAAPALPATEAEEPADAPAADIAAAPADPAPPDPPSPVRTEAPPPAETPQPEAKPIEQAAIADTPPAAPSPQAAPAPKPYEPPPVVVSPFEPPAEEESEAASSEADATAPPSPAEEEPETPAAEAPEPAPAVTESAALDPVALPPAANDGSTRYGIEIGAVAKQDGLRPLWREFLTNHAALVAGLQPRRVLAPDKKWRLIAGPFGSAAEAAQACALFKKASRPCEATVYAGDSL
jgi:hypothetical protein